MTCLIRDYRKSPIQYATGCLEVVVGEIDYLLYIRSRSIFHPTELPIIKGATMNLFHNAAVACKLLGMKERGMINVFT